MFYLHIQYIKRFSLSVCVCVVDSFSVCGHDLHRDSVMNFWMAIGVLNAMAVYATWSFVQLYKSFTVFLVFEVNIFHHLLHHHSHLMLSLSLSFSLIYGFQLLGI